MKKMITLSASAMIIMVMTITSCEVSSDPGYDGPSQCTCGNGGGGTGGNGGVWTGGGSGSIPPPIEGYVYGLPAGGMIGVDTDMNGSEDITVYAHQNLYGDLNSECFNVCPVGYIKRAIVSVKWTQDTYGNWKQFASFTGCASY